MRAPRVNGGAGSSNKFDTKGILPCPSSPKCHRYLTAEDGCVWCRACQIVLNAHLEPNAYDGRGRA